MSVIGIRAPTPLVISTDIDDQLLATLKTWAATYLRLYMQDRQLAFTPALPRTYANTFEGFEFLDHQLPALVATTAQMTSTIGGGNRTYEAATRPHSYGVAWRYKRPAATRYLAATIGGSQRDNMGEDKVAKTSALIDCLPQATYNEVCISGRNLAGTLHPRHGLPGYMEHGRIAVSLYDGSRHPGCRRATPTRRPQPRPTSTPRSPRFRIDVQGELRC